MVTLYYYSSILLNSCIYFICILFCISSNNVLLHRTDLMLPCDFVSSPHTVLSLVVTCISLVLSCIANSFFVCCIHLNYFSYFFYFFYFVVVGAVVVCVFVVEDECD